MSDFIDKENRQISTDTHIQKMQELSPLANPSREWQQKPTDLDSSYQGHV